MKSIIKSFSNRPIQNDEEWAAFVKYEPSNAAKPLLYIKQLLEDRGFLRSLDLSLRPASRLEAPPIEYPTLVLLMILIPSQILEMHFPY